MNDSESQESGLFSLHLDCISLVNYKEKVESMIAITEEDYYEIRVSFMEIKANKI